MRRPKKRKVEATEMTVQDDSELEGSTGITGMQQPTLEPSSEACAMQDPTAGPGHKKWRKTLNIYEEALMKAMELRVFATMHEEKEKLAQRIFDAKMRRLDAGDKQKRRKRMFAAARKTYTRRSLRSSQRSYSVPWSGVGQPSQKGMHQRLKCASWSWSDRLWLHR